LGEGAQHSDRINSQLERWSASLSLKNTYGIDESVDDDVFSRPQID
jgi:hypothetical protein